MYGTGRNGVERRTVLQTTFLSYEEKLNTRDSNFCSFIYSLFSKDAFKDSVQFLPILHYCASVILILFPHHENMLI